MKRGWIAGLLIALSLIAGLTEYGYVRASTSMYLSLLDEAQERMASGEVHNAQSTAERLERRFEGQSGMFNIFMYHSEVGHIASDLSRLKEYARTGDASEFLATASCAKTEIEAIREAKSVRWDNIF